MLTVIWRRHPQVRVILAPALVQGVGAAEQIAAGIELLNQLPEIETIIIGRGGGSIEDLWSFNEEVVVRAVAASHKPLVSAVGHETDVTLADLAADLRAPTPSAAAEMVVPEVAILLQSLNSKEQRLVLLMGNRLRQQQEHLAALQEKLEPQRLYAWVPEKRSQVESFQKRIQTSVRQQLTLAKMRLESNQMKLELLSPRSVLDRGFLSARNPKTGQLITSVQSLRFGDDLELEFADGLAEVRVLQVTPKEQG